MAQGELSPNGRRRIYQVLLRVARADGRTDPAEVTALARMRADLGLTEAEARALEAEPPAEGLRLGHSPQERALVARLMVELACADGDVARRELLLLGKLARAIGLPPEQLEGAIRQAMAAPPQPAGRPPQGGIVTGLPPAPGPARGADDLPRWLLATPSPSLAQAVRAALERGAARELVAWGLARVAPAIAELEATPSEGTERQVLELTADLEVARGWVERPDWVRRTAVLDACELLSPRAFGAFDELFLEELPRFAAPFRLLCGLLHVIGAADTRGELRRRSIDDACELLEQVPPAWFDEPARLALAHTVTRGAPAPPAVDRARWAARVDAWLGGPGVWLWTIVALERLGRARPEAFQQLRDEVTACFPFHDSPLAGLLPWSQRRLGEPAEEADMQRCVGRARHAAARFRSGDPPRRHERLLPLEGAGVRALRLILDDARDEPLARHFFAWLREYLASGARFEDGQTLEYCCFPLRVRLHEGVLALEAPDLRGFVAGRWTPSLSDAFVVTALQGAVATVFDLDVVPARLDRAVAVSHGSERPPATLVRCDVSRGVESGFELREQRTRDEPPPGIDPGPLPSDEELEAARLERLRDSARLVSLWEVATVSPFVLPFLALPVGCWAIWTGHAADLPLLGREQQALPDGAARLRAAFDEVARLCGRSLEWASPS